MRLMNQSALLTAAAMLPLAGLVLFLLPPAQDDSERAFRSIVVAAAIVAAIVKLRRARQGPKDRG